MKIFKILLCTFFVSAIGCSTKRTASHKSPISIEEKYSKLLSVKKEDVTNKKLYSFIDNWYGAPYQYAGKTKKGIDCSGFTNILFHEVYAKELNGPSSAIYSQCKKIPYKELKEGDLVFFKIDSKEVSHVGIYLQNDKFVHASTKKGVVINDLNEEYYKKHFFSGGRIR